MNVLILHGIQGKAGENWGQWLHDQLVQRSFIVIMPTLPAADHPDRQTWLQTITSAVQAIPPEDLIIVGHSLGVTSALDYIERLKADQKLYGLVSISGFAKDYGLELNSYFLQEKTVDFSIIAQHLRQAVVFYGDNDPYVTQAALASLANELHITPKVIHEGGHLNTNAGFSEFPALLETILAL